MISALQAGRTGFFIALLLAVTACSDSNTNGGAVSPENESGTSTSGTSTTDGGSSTTGGSTDVGEPTTEGSTTSDNADGADSTTGGESDSGATSVGDSDGSDGALDGNTDSNGTTDGSDGSSTDAGGSSAGDSDAGSTTGEAGTDGSSPPSNGVDLSGGDDDSPTATETASLQGPFIRDESRGAGPPSSPAGLTALLTSDNWVEFTWSPSADDQSVEAYEIYRDGSLLFTVRGDTNYEFDYRYWLTTSYIDCNYTRYPGCRDTQPAAAGAYEYTVVAVDNEGMRSGPSEPLVIQLVQPQSGGADLTDYSIVFEDEFDGDGLDRSSWKTALPWGPDRIINGELQYFVNIFGSSPPSYDPFVFTGETLQITGIETPSELLSDANNQPYLSGVITTADYFEMTYGYVEMSARVAGGEGLLSTFYLFNQYFDDNKPEIDIVEYIGSRPDKAYQTYHYFDSNRARWASGENHSSPTMETNTGITLSAGYHNYSVLWEPGLMVWYIDGAEVRRVVGPRVSDEPMNIIAQLVIGSEWIGSPTPASLPATFEIDYIRAWQRN
ncbi:MAG: family 16 glycosylhydrolase [Gammaproteobacteria bacterium]|nr:family 16 glycosylhydrolase [Gammaproteobacteria bacterium]